MSHAWEVVIPDDECCSCGTRFKKGDKAMALVKLPSCEAETMCMPDYAAMIAAAVVGFRGLPDDSAEPLRRLFLDALDVVTSEDEAKVQRLINDRI